MTENLSVASKWKYAIGLSLVWLVFCLPFWLLGLGFAGRFFLPFIATDAADAFLISLCFCVLFYGLLLGISALVWSALKDRKRPQARKGS